ncbi:MAG: hypothetical protein GC191_00645 [Azospirillum sp.]|nr:hypothetical protein [Azospirillum sp.]
MIAMRVRALGLGLLLLTGCSALEPGGEPVNKRQAACLRSCDRGYEVCTDADSARREGNPLFGGGAACDRQFDQCHKRCLPPRPAKPAKSAGQDAPSGSETEAPR